MGRYLLSRFHSILASENWSLSDPEDVEDSPTSSLSETSGKQGIVTATCIFKTLFRDLPPPHLYFKFIVRD